MPECNGQDSFTYIVSDGKGGTDTATVTIDVTIDPSIIPLGFVINGIDTGDFSGQSVSAAGDVNGDGVDDLIIDAYLGDPNGINGAGETYFIFGKTGLGAGGSFDLSGLDGTKGYILNGIDAVDRSGTFVSYAGESYVVLGGDGLNFAFYDQLDGQADGQIDLSLLLPPVV